MPDAPTPPTLEPQLAAELTAEIAELRSLLTRQVAHLGARLLRLEGLMRRMRQAQEDQDAEEE